MPKRGPCCFQITGDLTDYARYTGKLKILVVYGGASIDNQIRGLKIGAHIIVATPGRLIDLIDRGAAKLPDVSTVILDEADEMLNMGFLDSYNADALHGDLSQAQRDAVMQKLRLRNLQLLVATDVAARGLDVDDLTHVINFSLPDGTEVYTHRCGRTGRAGKTGISVSLVHLREKQNLKKMERGTENFLS